MIDAGALNRRIKIESKTATTNTFGEEVATWNEVATVWAQKQTLTVKDVNRQQGQSAKAEARFLIRHRDDLDSTMRVIYKGDVLYITGIEDYQDAVGQLLYVRRM